VVGIAREKVVFGRGDFTVNWRWDFRKLALNGFRGRVLASWVLAAFVLLIAGCAKYNTYYNAKRAFDDAEYQRNEKIREHQDPGKPTGQQATLYETAALKAQKVIDNYPGHSLTDDALFLQGKAHHRLESYRMSIRNLENLFLNFPATPYQEEALYLQALNYLLIGAVDRSQDYLDLLASQFPESDYQAETLKVSGDNAFTLERWAEAAENYQQYLESYKEEDEERDRIGLKLAECYWELKDFEQAATILQDVSKRTESAELAFRARLLRARVHVRMGDYNIADTLLDEIDSEASVYESQRAVQMVKAENLVAQGKGDEAAPLLENIPEDWKNDPDAKARSAEMLGNLYLERGMLLEAKGQFRQAVGRKDALEDENQARLLVEALDDFLAAEQALPDAPAERIPRLKLLQANSMLFGFQRPDEAARLFSEAAVDTAADSTLTPRALFGALITYRDHLDMPDSAEYFAQRLLDEFPRSPQAFEVQHGAEGNLLGFLLDQRRERQAEAFAALSPEELEDLNKITDISEYSSGAQVAGSGVRRRMVYLARRDNILIEPSAELLAAAASRQPVGTSQVPTFPAPTDDPRTLTGENPPMPGYSTSSADSLRMPAVAPADSSSLGGGLDRPGVKNPQQRVQPEETKKREDKKEKKKKPKKFDLR
jgi:TolA-binding protein